MEHSPSMGGGAFPNQRGIDFEVGDPDFDRLEVHEVTP
jgi:hypothetical protein